KLEMKIFSRSADNGKPFFSHSPKHASLRQEMLAIIRPEITVAHFLHRVDMDLSQLGDIEIVERFKQQPETALIEELYRRYAKKVYWWALKFLQNSAEAEEIVQEIFIALMGNALANYQPREDAKFSSWLYRCVGNQCLKLLKGRNDSLNRQVEIDEVPQNLIAKIDLDGSLLLGERSELL